MDEPRSIPISSRRLGQVRGNYFRAVIYHTPQNEVAAEITIDPEATQAQLDGDQMNARIVMQSKAAAGQEPDYYVTHKKSLS